MVEGAAPEAASAEADTGPEEEPVELDEDELRLIGMLPQVPGLASHLTAFLSGTTSSLTSR